MTTATEPTSAGVASTLRRLYLVRFGFALGWAGLLFATGHQLGPLSATLLVLYPLFDVASALFDARASQATGSVLGPYVNVGISLLAGITLSLAVFSGIPAVLRIWGIWAVFSGLVQLAVGIRRRALGGQWPMIASGSISTVAGISFFLQASAESTSLSTVAGYALFGGIFFLISALRLGRTTATAL
jgi:uncharacterized membrane protein HdeD (DUF308 family)